MASSTDELFGVEGASAPRRSANDVQIFHRWAGRAALGIGLGWLWATLVCLIWLGLGLIVYRDLGKAFDYPDNTFLATLLIAMFSSLAAWAGGIVGPLAFDVYASRFRRPVLVSSAFGGASSAVLATVIGLSINLFVRVSDTLGHDDDDDLFMLATFLAGSIVGLVGGWMGARATAWADRHRCTS